jgi:hypothetical protein
MIFFVVSKLSFFLCMVQDDSHALVLCEEQSALLFVTLFGIDPTLWIFL